MAEFSVVMKQAARMCKAYGGECRKCPADDSKHHICMIWPEAIEYRYSTPEQAEQIVMDWADKNPEPRYPTWIEWWNENFSSKGRRMFTPCSFVPPAELGCSIGMDGCMNAPYKCWHTPIPADIAEKLNIKPIGG